MQGRYWARCAFLGVGFRVSSALVQRRRSQIEKCYSTGLDNREHSPRLDSNERNTYVGPFGVRLFGSLKYLSCRGSPADYGVFPRCNAAANPRLRLALHADSKTTPDSDILHESGCENFQYSRFATASVDRCRAFECDYL